MSNSSQAGIAAVLVALAAGFSGATKLAVVKGLLDDPETAPAGAPDADAYEGAMSAVFALHEAGFTSVTVDKAQAAADALMPEGYEPTPEEPEAPEGDEGDDETEEPEFPDDWKKADYQEACDELELEYQTKSTIDELQQMLREAAAGDPEDDESETEEEASEEE